MPTPRLAEEAFGVRLSGLVAVVQDRALSMEDRAGAYALLYSVQLALNRAIRGVRDELVEYIVREDLRALGPLTIRTTAIDPAYPCNDPGNWTDVGVQDGLEALRADPAYRPYVREVPEHLEINTAALGEGVSLADPAARRLHAELKVRGWRTEVGRRLGLAVRPPTPAAPERAG